jgi:RNA 3'-terminal phosphate cyclase
MYWSKGACRVEVLRRGHYPSTVKVRLENGVETEVELEDLKDVG